MRSGGCCAPRAHLANGYREFPPSAVERVHQIKLAQELGFSLTEIARELRVASTSGNPNERIARLFQEKAATLQGRIAALAQARDTLLARMSQACPMRCAWKCAEDHAAAGCFLGGVRTIGATISSRPKYTGRA